MREAVSRRRAFNVIHFETVEKVDVFVTTDEPWSREQMARRQLWPLIGAEAGQRAYYASPEDTVLSKLRWYRLGGEVSDRQWSDIAMVMQVQGDRLDDSYLDRWAESLDLTELLARARRDAAAID